MDAFEVFEFVLELIMTLMFAAVFLALCLLPVAVMIRVIQLWGWL